MARHHGAAVLGSDISAEACAFVRDRLHIEVFEGPLGRAAPPVDIAVLSDVIEHPADPLSLLQTAVTVLAHRGLLLILTPNGGQAGTNVETARRWDGFRVDPEHLQYFSPATMVRLAPRLGCRIEHLETRGFLSDADTGAGTPQSAPALPALRRLLRPVKRALHTVREAFHPPEDPATGSFNLFTILRKL